MTDEESEASNSVDKDFEAWWLRLIQREPHFSEYLKVKRICRDAFVAGRSSPFGREEQAA